MINETEILNAIKNGKSYKDILNEMEILPSQLKSVLDKLNRLGCIILPQPLNTIDDIYNDVDDSFERSKDFIKLALGLKGDRPYQHQAPLTDTQLCEVLHYRTTSTASENRRRCGIDTYDNIFRAKFAELMFSGNYLNEIDIARILRKTVPWIENYALTNNIPLMNNVVKSKLETFLKEHQTWTWEDAAIDLRVSEESLREFADKNNIKIPRRTDIKEHNIKITDNAIALARNEIMPGTNERYWIKPQGRSIKGVITKMSIDVVNAGKLMR